MNAKDQRATRQRSGGRWVRSILLGLLVLGLGFAGVVLVTGAQAKAALKATYPPPGQLVEMGGYQLHIVCQGTGEPTVVMEAGQGEFSLTWALVQPTLAATTRVCVYDRAGLGWSAVSPKPRTAEQIVEELHRLLRRAQVAAPYLLVGHSMGGLYVRLYAHRYPQEVAGLVLVDASHEAQTRRQPPALQQAIQREEQQMAQQLRIFQLLIASGLAAQDPAQAPVDPRLPAATRTTYQALIVSDNRFLATLAAERAATEASLAQVRAAQITTLGTLPLIVLTHGQSEPPADLNLSPAVWQQWEQLWHELQQELARQSAHGTLVVAEQSDHYIHLAQPDLVLDAIRQVWAAARR